MKRSSQTKLLVHCILSDLAMGCAEEGKVFDVGQRGSLRTTFHSLIDGDHLSVKIQLPDERRPVSVHLAKVSWMQGNRFGVELLVMDVGERIRLHRFLEAKLPLELELQDSHTELIIKKAD
ncbi:MAG: hypothetical protein QM771_10370 [Nitrospira sp.]